MYLCIFDFEKAFDDVTIAAVVTFYSPKKKNRRLNATKLVDR